MGWDILYSLFSLWHFYL